MNGAVFGSTFNVFFKLKYNRLYDAVLATPLGPVDIALGEIGWALLRGALYALGFLAVMGLRPAALAGACSRCRLRSWSRSASLPSGWPPPPTCARGRTSTSSPSRSCRCSCSRPFYPLSVYPRWLQLLVEAMPLFHAVELMRGLTTGAVHLGMLGHLSYFLVMIVLGLVVAARRLDILLLK